MKKIPFSVRLFLSYFLIVAALSAGVLFFITQEIENFNRETSVSELRVLCIALMDPVQTQMAADSNTALDRYAKEMGPRLGVRITVIRPDGVVIADSDHAVATMDNHGSRPEVVGALSGEEGHSIRYSKTLQENLLYLAKRFPPTGVRQGTLRVSMRMRKVDAVWAQVGTEVLLTAGICLLGALILAFFASRRLGQPVRKLAWAAERLSQGDFETRVFLDRHDELKDLADGFNRMAGQVSRLFQELGRKSEEYRVILSSIREGLVVIDRDARIVHANEAFWTMIGRPPAEGIAYWEVVRIPELAEGLRQVKETGQRLTEEIPVAERTYLCGFTPLPENQATVLLFFDITEQKRLEGIKRDLVVNISHEFKTPLTAIRGFAEALEEEAKINREHIEIIKRNAERLARITDDLLLLARLEQPSRALERVPVDLPRLVEEIRPLFQSQLAQKDLSLEVQAAEDVPPVSADRYMMEQVFINLIGNAIRYTEQGGLTIRFCRDGGKVVVEIEDTGIGFAAEHLPRVFERFYVVDKSRSRATGGTGLGLSIVKNVVLQHGGAIDIRSRPGAGTTVVVSFPAL
jgi:two-component system phosphate regulon sensor histidine kinase PhoR